jgi:hypothetical protein
MFCIVQVELKNVTDINVAVREFSPAGRMDINLKVGTKKEIARDHVDHNTVRTTEGRAP